MSEFFTASISGTLREVFCVGTAAVVIPAGRIGWQLNSNCGGGSRTEAEQKAQDIFLPVVGGEGSVAHTLGSSSWIYRKGTSGGRGGAYRAKKRLSNSVMVRD
jgi:hypothetical protein